MLKSLIRFSLGALVCGALSASPAAAQEEARKTRSPNTLSPAC